MHSLVKSIKHKATEMSTCPTSDLRVPQTISKFLQMFFKCSSEKNSLLHHLSTWQSFKYLKTVIIFLQSFSSQTTDTHNSLKSSKLSLKRCLWHISNLENITGNTIAGSTKLSEQQILCRGLCNFIMRCSLLNSPRKNLQFLLEFSLNNLTYHRACCEVFSFKRIYIAFPEQVNWNLFSSTTCVFLEGYVKTRLCVLLSFMTIDLQFWRIQ